MNPAPTDANGITDKSSTSPDPGGEKNAIGLPKQPDRGERW
jgi:hypothetical protein